MKRKIPKGYKKGGVTSAKAKRKKLQNGGGPDSTLQSRMNEKQMKGWKKDLDFLSNYTFWEDDPQGFTPEQIKTEKAKQAKKVAELQRYIGVTDENRNTFTEGNKTFTYNPEKDQKKREAAIRNAYGMNKEISTDPMPGVSNVANLASGFAATSYAKADAQKQSEANQLVSDVTKNSAIGASPLKLEVEKERARQKGFEMTSDVNYAGRGAVEGGLKGVAVGANLGPLGAFWGGVGGTLIGAATGGEKGSDIAFAEDERKKGEKGRLLGIQDEIRRNIDTTKEENPTIASVNVRKGGKVKMLNGGTIIGPGTGTSDNISGQLEPNDFVAIASKRREADTIRRKYGLPNQKATLKKGGNAMKKIPVKVSNGETLFTKEEINKILAQGGTLDELNALAPNADIPLQDGGKAGKYESKKEDWYSGTYIGNDPIVKKKIEAEKLKNQIKELDFIKSKESAKATDDFYAYSAGVSPESMKAGQEITKLKKKLTSVNEDIKRMTKSVDLDIQKERLNTVKDRIQNEINETRKQIDNAKTNQEVEKLGKKVKELTDKNDKLQSLNLKIKSDYTSNFRSRPDVIKTRIDNIMGVEKTSKQPTETVSEDFDITEITDFDTDDLGGAGVLKQQATTTGTSIPSKTQTGAGTLGTSSSTKPPTTTPIPFEISPNESAIDEDLQEQGKMPGLRWNKRAQKWVKDPLYQEPEVEEVEETEETDGTETEEVTEKEELPWSDILGIGQAGMGIKGLAEDQRPIGVKSADLAAQQARIDAAKSGFTYPIDETLRQIEGERKAASIPTSGERGYEFAKNVAAQDVASRKKAEALERKSILEGQAADRFGLTKLGLQGQMAGALAAQDRMLFQDDMQAFQQKQASYAELLNAGISNFIQGREARATREAMKDIEGNTTINIG